MTRQRVDSRRALGLPLALVAALALTACGRAEPAPPAPPAPVVLSAFDAFPLTEIEGFVPFYRDEEQGALAVDASLYPDRFAAAATTFAGPEGLYDVTITTLTEFDGESTYRLRVNGELAGTFQNPADEENFNVVVHTWRDVRLRATDTLQVESNTHSNGRIPEDGAFAWARGRWRQIELQGR